MSARIFIFLVIALLTACEKNKPVVMPPPQTLTREANGYYCLMTVLNHKGPKAQVILDDKPAALWFTSARDMIAFTRSAEEPKNIAAIYVNDMSNADWDNPGVDNWIDARKAWYVLGSHRSGGMGGPEAVPFSSREKASAFASEQGGKVYGFDAIPAEAIQAPAR
jgi:copper chaperone NosL